MQAFREGRPQDGRDEGRHLPELPAGPGQAAQVIDDEPTVRTLVTEVLEDLAYTAIEVAADPGGPEVLRSNVRIDLPVTDILPPGGTNVRQVADAAGVSGPRLKVLSITGHAENAVPGDGHSNPAWPS